jgi:hypothetical protein
MKSHCSAQGVVCKHVVFALWKVGKYREWSYFDTKTIDDMGYEFLLNSALERDALFSDRTIVDRDLVGQFERLGFGAGTSSKVESGPSIVDEPASAQAPVQRRTVRIRQPRDYAYQQAPMSAHLAQAQTLAPAQEPPQPQYSQTPHTGGEEQSYSGAGEFKVIKLG